MNKAVINLEKEPGESSRFNSVLKEFHHKVAAIFFSMFVLHERNQRSKRSAPRVAASFNNYLNSQPLSKGVQIRSPRARIPLGFLSSQVDDPLSCLPCRSDNLAGFCPSRTGSAPPWFKGQQPVDPRGSGPT